MMDVLSNAELGRRLSGALSDRGLSGSVFATRAGFSMDTLGLIEGGDRDFTPDVRRAIAAALGDDTWLTLGLPEP